MIFRKLPCTRLLTPLILILHTISSFASTPSVDCDKQLFDGIFDQSQKYSEETTTSLRREMKIVADVRWVREFLNNLALSFGELVPRDRAPEGRYNVTSTDYLQRLRTSSSAQQGRVAKIRFRRYFERNEGDSLIQAVSGAWPEDLVKMEFKVDHQSAPGVINKHTIVLNAADVGPLLLDRASYIASRRKILVRARALRDPTTGKQNNRSLVDHMIQSLDLLYAQNITLTRLVNIRYEREAYKIDLVDSESGLKVPIQMTIDHDIQYRRASTALRVPVTGLPLKSYPENDYVVEIKIPLVFADLDHKFWSQNKAHQTLVQEIRKLMSHQAPWIPIDHGKLSAGDFLDDLSD